MHICTYTHVHIHTYTHTRIHMYTYTQHTYTYTHVYIHTHMGRGGGITQVTSYDSAIPDCYARVHVTYSIHYTKHDFLLVAQYFPLSTTFSFVQNIFKYFKTRNI